MIVEPFAADPAFPGLQTAGDPTSVRRLLERHLRPAGATAYSIRVCRVSRVRYRKGARCVLQYVLDLVDPATGVERSQWVTGVMYAGGKTRRKWEKLRDSAREVPGADPAFEPFAFVPELDMLVEVFPYDRRLPGLTLLMAGTSPELETSLLAGFGPGWTVEDQDVELVRYRSELGATVRVSVRAREEATCRVEERRFYAKTYHDGGGERTYGVLRALGDRVHKDDTAFRVGPPVAYLAGLQTLIQEEMPGVTCGTCCSRARKPTWPCREQPRPSRSCTSRGWRCRACTPCATRSPPWRGREGSCGGLARTWRLRSKPPSGP